MNRTPVISYENSPQTQAAPGILRRVLAHNPNLMLVEHQLAADTLLARHSHPHDQLLFILSGRLRFFIADEPPFEAGAGDSFVILGDVEHEALVLEDSVVLDCFSPSRLDFLE